MPVERKLNVRTDKLSNKPWWAHVADHLELNDEQCQLSLELLKQDECTKEPFTNPTQWINSVKYDSIRFFTLPANEIFYQLIYDYFSNPIGQGMGHH
jgi:hypothetical protein